MPAGKFIKVYKGKKQSGRKAKPVRRSAALKPKSSLKRDSTTRALTKLYSRAADPNSLSGIVATQQGSGIPNNAFVRQIYWERVLLGSGGPPLVSYTWKLNSTFDPNETGGGHQAKGRDFYASMYNDYTVISADYSVQFINNGTGKKLVGCLISTNATALPAVFDTQQEIMETKSKYNKKRLLYGSADSVREEAVTIKGHIDLKNFLLSGSGSFQDQMTAGVGSNPNTVIRLHAWGMMEDGVTAVPLNNLIVRAEINYNVDYSGVVQATSS